MSRRRVGGHCVGGRGVGEFYEVSYCMAGCCVGGISVSKRCVGGRCVGGRGMGGFRVAGYCVDEEAGGAEGLGR